MSMFEKNAYQEAKSLEGRKGAKNSEAPVLIVSGYELVAIRTLKFLKTINYLLSNLHIPNPEICCSIINPEFTKQYDYLLRKWNLTIIRVRNLNVDVYDVLIIWDLVRFQQFGVPADLRF